MFGKARETFGESTLNILHGNSVIWRREYAIVLEQGTNRGGAPIGAGGGRVMTLILFEANWDGGHNLGIIHISHITP